MDKGGENKRRTNSTSKIQCDGRVWTIKISFSLSPFSLFLSLFPQNENMHSRQRPSFFWQTVFAAANDDNGILCAVFMSAYTLSLAFYTFILPRDPTVSSWSGRHYSCVCDLIRFGSIAVLSLSLLFFSLAFYSLPLSFFFISLNVLHYILSL